MSKKPPYGGFLFFYLYLPSLLWYNLGTLVSYALFYQEETLNYLRDLWQALDLTSLEDTLLRVAGVLLCLVLHEVCHGLAAYALGDPTAKQSRRLSLNPLHHIDWLGLASMFFAGVGWAKPVPVDSRYFRRPKIGMAITALAGPVSNLLLAFALLLIAKFTQSPDAFYFLLDTAILSIGLGLFNLIPLPPLDGSKVLAVVLPDKVYRVWMRYEHLGLFVVILLMGLGVFSNVLGEGITAVLLFMARILGI